MTVIRLIIVIVGIVVVVIVVIVVIIVVPPLQASLLQLSIQKKVQSLCAESPEIHWWAKRCFVSYVRSVFLQVTKISNKTTSFIVPFLYYTTAPYFLV